MDRLQPVPSEQGRCVKPHDAKKQPLQKEIDRAGQLSKERGDTFVFPKSANQDGIDGFFKGSGQTFQLKQCKETKDTPGKIVAYANDANKAAEKHNWSNVEVHIEAPRATRQEALDRWSAGNRVPAPKEMRSDVIKSVTVYCSDGRVNMPLRRPSSTR